MGELRLRVALAAVLVVSCGRSARDVDPEGPLGLASAAYNAY